MRKTHSNLSRERLQEILYYNPDTGEFLWRKSHGRKKAGAVAGGVTGRGYHQINVEKIMYQAHRLAWLYMTGDWPTNFIDHINGIRTDNRFFNLRDVTGSQNNQNSRSSWGSSVFRGVHWNNQKNKWQAAIRLNGKRQHLGLFDTEEDAAEAYKLARQRFHPFAPVN